MLANSGESCPSHVRRAAAKAVLPVVTWDHIISPEESEALVAKVVEFCERKDIWLLMDDTYNRLVFDGRNPTNCYAFTKEDVERSKLLEMAKKARALGKAVVKSINAALGK